MPVACPAGTRGLEARLRRDGGHFALLTSYTHDSEPMQTTVMLRALDERAPLPFRVLLEEVDTETWTHTLSEGAFATFGATTQWWEAHWRGDGGATAHCRARSPPRHSTRCPCAWRTPCSAPRTEPLSVFQPHADAW
ncbi:hypothetical protein [Streptomyces sp. NPDC059122]|uniref:hypothetical protein n=1 Tax=Streptomyces sp. NPDC059122 TaxID=3346732 RepID=UPI0036A75C7E